MKKIDEAAELERIKLLYTYENKYYLQGNTIVAGVDECGRGCLAGPVAAAAVILPENCVIPGLNDSKKLSEAARERIYEIIMEKALAVGFATVAAEIIDETNIVKATFRAMDEAARKLKIVPEVLLIDGNILPDIHIEGAKLEAIIKGDQKSASIAAASIIAKVSRDRLMHACHNEYPAYNFAQNKAYGTKEHIEAITRHGICPLHRKTFVKKFIPAPH